MADKAGETMDKNVIPDLLKNEGETKEAKHTKPRGSVGADLFAYNDQGTVGMAYRDLAKRRRQSYIREY